MKKFLIAIPILIVAFIIGVSIYLQPNDFIGCSDAPTSGDARCAKVDAIVVVSGGDTNARTDEGIKLYKNGWADVIIFSGAAQDKTGLSNAAAMRLRALQAGVATDSIFVDEQSETTEQNAQYTRAILENHNYDTVMLVTSGYHQRRASLEFERQTGSVKVLNHPLYNDKDWSFIWWLSPFGWWLAGGEIVKIMAFYGSGTAS